jgi:molybdopterin synthase catalytic subunit
VQLTVLFFAGLRERAGVDELVLDDLSEPLSVGQFKAELGRRHPELGDLTSVAGVLGTDYVPDGHLLCGGDRLALLPPVSGGQADPGDEDVRLAAGLFELSAEPIDPGRLAQRVQHPACGAVVTFTGVTRDHNRERDVVELDYEAFEAMTGPEMGRIFKDCRSALEDPELFGGEGGETEPLRMLCVHRTGRVGVGEPSVVISVASPHREAAFFAARFLIESLKERLPVWKKEVYQDGQHWIGERS